jgi:hypothetical protein
MSWTKPVISGAFAAPAATVTTTTLPVVTIPDATAYFATTPRSAEWAAVTTQQIWLDESQRYLKQLCVDQDADCCGMTFAEAWTATASEAALALSKAPSAVIGGGAVTSTQGAIKSQKLGDLQQDFYDTKSGQETTAKYGKNAPIILRKFPWIGDLLGCYMTQGYGSSRILSRCC